MNDENDNQEDETESVWEPSLIRFKSVIHPAPCSEDFDTTLPAEAEACDVGPMISFGS